MKLVRVHSHEGAATLHPRRYGAYSAAMVRISTMPAFVPLVFRDDYLDVLEVRFADVTTEGWKYIVEHDQDLIEVQLAEGHAMWPMAERHAKAITDFVDSVADKVELLVVHCDAGVSRSSATAIAICEQYQLLDDLRFIQNSPKYRPNLTVRDMLRKQWEPEGQEERQKLYDRLFNKDNER
jgi:predicted protein tyrosine phosphatase